MVFPIPRAQLSNQEFCAQQRPQEAPVKTLWDPQVWTGSYWRTSPQTETKPQVTKWGTQSRREGKRGPRCWERGSGGKLGPEPGRSQSWLEWGNRDQQGRCQEKITFLSDTFPCFKSYTLLEERLGMMRHCAQKTNIYVITATQTLNT